MSIVEDFKNNFIRNGNSLTKIILVNAVIFILINIIDSLSKLTGSNYLPLFWLAISGNIPIAITRPWTLITYMFLHRDLFHILFNMLWLYWIGNIFLEYVGSKRLVGVYLLGGISGGVLYALSALVFPLYFQNTFLLGASAGVMAIVIATAILVPNYTINLILLGPIRLKYLALFSFLLSSVLDLSQNTGGKIAHIGGALFGIIFMLYYKKGKDITKPLIRLFNSVESFFSKKSIIKVSYRRKVSDEEYNLNKKEKQEKTDEILDKISKSGYESLTKEEKDYLFNVSGKH